MNDRDLEHLTEIVECCLEIADKLVHFELDSFQKWYTDKFARDSVLLSLSRIGETVAQLKDREAVENAFPTIAWSQIKAMRNFIVHDYKNIDLDLAWKAATEEVNLLADELMQNVEVRNLFVADQSIISEELQNSFDEMRGYQGPSESDVIGGLAPVEELERPTKQRNKSR